MKKSLPTLLPLARFGFFLLAAAQFVSCGLEEYYYLPSLQESGGNIGVELNNKATIRLPNINTSSGGYYYFRHFTIFYRIYISGQNESGQIQTSGTALSNINASLASDYSAIYPSTDITSTTSNTAVGSLFRNRRYYELALESEDIKNRLSSPGGTLILEFPTNVGEWPLLTLGGSSSRLYRSNGEGAFKPEPNRYFLNSSDLNKRENAVPLKNADVADNPSLSESAVRYTYVSLYIVLEGIDERNFTPIYSRPTFIGIFKLPEAN
jgi:hypothetical protein